MVACLQDESDKVSSVEHGSVGHAAADDHAYVAMQTRANAAGALGNLVRNGPALVQVGVDDGV
jgi:hypothetical protein